MRSRPGENPYVATKATNNGIQGFYDYATEQGNVLVVDSAVVVFCSYQPDNFTESDHVEKLVPNLTRIRMLDCPRLPLSTASSSATTMGGGPVSPG